MVNDFSARRILLGLLMLVQVIVPSWLLLKPTNDGPQRFAWQMFSRPAPYTAFQLVLADGRTEKVTKLANLDPPLRADIMLTPELITLACSEIPSAKTLRVDMRRGGSEDFNCDQTLRSIENQ